jgi:hypothetical protein
MPHHSIAIMAMPSTTLVCPSARFTRRFIKKNFLIAGVGRQS